MASQPQAGKAAPKSRNLILRGVSAIAVLALIYFCFAWDLRNETAWAWCLFMALFSLCGLREFYRFAAACGTSPFSWFGMVMGPLWILALEWDLSGGARSVGLAVQATDLVFSFAVLGSMLLQLTRKTNETALASVGMTVFGILYCAYLPGFLLHMRHMELGPGGWPMHGVELVVVCIFVAKVSDVGALLTGSRWGKHKLIPRLSPGKTREGAIGGLIFSVLLLQLMSWTDPALCLNELGKPLLLLLSALMAVAALGGDLVESCFKRNSQMKDAGTGVPGFGGMLDLTDSLIVAAPVMYYFLVACGAKVA